MATVLFLYMAGTVRTMKAAGNPNTRKHHSEWQMDELSTKGTDWTERVERGKQPLLRQLVIEERKHLKFNSYEKF